MQNSTIRSPSILLLIPRRLPNKTPPTMATGTMSWCLTVILLVGMTCCNEDDDRQKPNQIADQVGKIGESLAFEKLITNLRKSVDSALIPIDGKERKGKADLKSMAETVSEKLRNGVEATKRLQDAIQNTHFDGNVTSEACCNFDESNFD